MPKPFACTAYINLRRQRAFIGPTCTGGQHETPPTFECRLLLYVHHFNERQHDGTLRQYVMNSALATTVFELGKPAKGDEVELSKNREGYQHAKNNAWVGGLPVVPGQETPC